MRKYCAATVIPLMHNAHLIGFGVEGARVQEGVCGVHRRLGERHIDAAGDVAAAAGGVRHIVAAAGAPAVLAAVQQLTIPSVQAIDCSTLVPGSSSILTLLHQGG